MSRADDDTIRVALSLAGYRWGRSMLFGRGTKTLQWFCDSNGAAVGWIVVGAHRQCQTTALVLPAASRAPRGLRTLREGLSGRGVFFVFLPSAIAKTRVAGRRTVERYVAKRLGLIAALPPPSKRSPRRARNSKTEPSSQRHHRVEPNQSS